MTEHLSEFKTYKRRHLSEIRSYVPGDDMTNISISEKDKAEGSPKIGDMIVRNPIDHTEQWLISHEYFVAHFMPTLGGNPTE